MKAGLSRSLAAWAATAVLLGAVATLASPKEEPDPVGKLRAGISEVVADPARAAKMQASVDEIVAAVRDVDALIVEERAALAALLRDHGSLRADVEASLADFNTRREPLAQRVLAAHAALKAEATAAEWKELRKLEVEMVTFAAARSLGQAPAAGRED